MVNKLSDFDKGIIVGVIFTILAGVLVSLCFNAILEEPESTGMNMDLVREKYEEVEYNRMMLEKEKTCDECNKEFLRDIMRKEANNNIE